MQDLSKPHADSSFVLLYPLLQLQKPHFFWHNHCFPVPWLFPSYLGIRGNRCPCSWLVPGREPGDTLQCRTGHVPSCRCSVCTRPGSRSPPPHKIPLLVLCTPPCPFPLADRCLTHLQQRKREKQKGNIHVCVLLSNLHSALCQINIHSACNSNSSVMKLNDLKRANRVIGHQN